MLLSRWRGRIGSADAQAAALNDCGPSLFHFSRESFGVKLLPRDFVEKKCETTRNDARVGNGSNTGSRIAAGIANAGI